VDAHKMLQAPYGTGLYFIRKELMHFVETDEAQYIEGKDYSICGSRSGANAVCVWMILRYYGSDGLQKRNNEFIERTDYLCKELDRLGIKYFRQAKMNIVTIRDGEIPRDICEKYTLVPDTHHKKTSWWKIVVMDHVDLDTIYRFLEEVEKEKTISY
jgi:glutamate/tyrosine decarboxylase-like PLP-dependent enzyme